MLRLILEAKKTPIIFLDKAAVALGIAFPLRTRGGGRDREMKQAHQPQTSTLGSLELIANSKADEGIFLPSKFHPYSQGNITF
jgi:hypothetical protein